MSESETEDWRAFQERVAARFRQIPGCSVSVGELLHGARIGTVETDVVARFGVFSMSGFGLRRSSIEFTVVVECKLWRKRVPQEKLFALKTIVEDVGAAYGILVSEVGVQSGAREYLNTPINVKAFSFSELEEWISGLYNVTCSVCGKEGQIIFRLSGDHPLFCRDCFTAMRAKRGGSKGRYGRPGR